jgi:hypothetical protein
VNNSRWLISGAPFAWVSSEPASIHHTIASEFFARAVYFQYFAGKKFKIFKVFSALKYKKLFFSGSEARSAMCNMFFSNRFFFARKKVLTLSAEL